MIFAGFSNINVSEQIAIREDGVIAGISRANQTISVYHGENLILDCTMPSTGLEDVPTIVMGAPTVHDESLTGFIEGETYTISTSDGTSFTGFVVDGTLTSFDVSNLWIITANNGKVFSGDYGSQHTNFSVSQNVTTVKKRYDIKLLPEDLLPKTVAKKVDVQKVQKIANNAQNTANTAQNTANTAQTTANKAQTTANKAQTTANAAAAKNNPVFTGSFSQNRKTGSTKGTYSHAEGTDTTASGNASHAEGTDTTASGNASHAEGYYTTASGDYSHAEGYFTTASGNASHAEGKCNIPDTAKAYAHIVGNGPNYAYQSNAYTLDWSGNAWFAGDVYVGSTSGTNKDDGSKKLATQEYADEKALGMDITGASAGQIIKIKSVDANGKPTEWESVDIVNLLPIYDGGVS